MWNSCECRSASMVCKLWIKSRAEAQWKWVVPQLKPDVCHLVLVLFVWSDPHWRQQESCDTKMRITFSVCFPLPLSYCLYCNFIRLVYSVHMTSVVCLSGERDPSSVALHELSTNFLPIIGSFFGEGGVEGQRVLYAVQTLSTLRKLCDLTWHDLILTAAQDSICL